ncbi:response regulator receiver protein [Fibrella aestuarina BUZ 2]|uniref:Response regulator receiver protein n=1 Tax=Fibrella aestuarina BUZ 2 TaxID=1166018 RepID=I0K2G6_9BACT|nr:response regulator [Fibrella aestuarina]CCG98319.1 response regulator receiver protein [Fibrella aestuarina BUZ 2]
MLDILYVEDNQDEVDVFKRVINRLSSPPTFTILTSGTEAIDFLLQQGTYQGQSVPMPRLVLVDLNLPGHSGFEVIQQVRATSRTRYLPLVVYSTSENPKDMRRAYELGANAYMIKPGSYHEVSDMMRQAIDFWLSQSQQML